MRKVGWGGMRETTPALPIGQPQVTRSRCCFGVGKRICQLLDGDVACVYLFGHNHSCSHRTLVSGLWASAVLSLNQRHVIFNSRVFKTSRRWYSTWTL